jgi:carbonic anhydrase
MKRRDFLKSLAAFGTCPLCARPASASGNWTYEGHNGPANWGSLDAASKVCAIGSQQSPIDIVNATEAKLPALQMAWKIENSSIVNNGHTFQITPLTDTNELFAGTGKYKLVQYHFHAPSEHHVDGRQSAMELHFVHQKNAPNTLGVIGVLLDPGRKEDCPEFSKIATQFSLKEGGQGTLAGANPLALLPASLDYWKYYGSLTTPPCAEVVEWMLLMDPVKVNPDAIAQFVKTYPGNARPIAPLNRRIVETSRTGGKSKS